MRGVARNMKVLLHIGTPKTGSSALQFFLNENRRLLAQCGYYYPEHSYDSNQVSGGHGGFLRWLESGEYEKARAQVDAWLKAASRKKLNLLLSAEGFYAKAGVLPALFSGYPLKVVAFVRNPVEFVVANHNQSIKRHLGTHTLHDVLANVPNATNRGVSGELLFEWAGAVGRDNLSVLAYHKPAFENGRVEYTFLQWLGVSGALRADFRLPERLINTSYTAEALELKRLLNAVLTVEDRPLNQRIDLFLQRYSDQSNNSSASSGGLPVQPEVLKRAYQAFEASNARLLKQLVDVPPEGFLKMPESYPEPRMPDMLEVCALERSMARELPDVADELRARVAAQLELRRPRYAIFRLADLMGIPYTEPRAHQTIAEPFLKAFRDPKADAADHLRTLAQLLNAEGFKKEALNAIRQAEKQRPNGPVIRELRQRLESDLRITDE